ncbi:outer membrane beta-barrel family protein [Neolewinella antarctica]|uniref:Outer membrane receptor protein involved in Fe transport n=1 Tax=Neolewinella antarctica TaxID=442734 RepID=A0ABX0XAK3_9BACT|nr:outer membrane beta-barrel family protein [Neolewinella antarctica]NJC26288.1 outer membrane receptor protein involved in Fe transport [Neolewinella antarctica]
MPLLFPTTAHPRPRHLLFFLLLFSGALVAQNGPNAPKTKGTVSGQLVDEATTDPIGFANVIVYTVQDSMISGTTTDFDGRFKLENLPLGDYRLEMSFIGYDTENRELELTEAERFFQTGKIVLGSGGQDLDEVVVTAERAVMELGLDRKVFNVEKSVAAAGGSAEDLLRQLPSISVDVEGNVSLRGSGNVRFLINGRPSGLVGADPVTYLKSLSSTAIERIEVITNPGAAFDPDGTAGLINIVLKKKGADGFNATLNANVGTNNKFDGSLDLNWRKGKFNTFAGLSGRYDERFFEGFRDQSGDLGDSTTSRFFTFDGDRVRESQSIRLGTDYALTERSTIGVQGNFQFQQGQSNNDRVTRSFDSEGSLIRVSNRLETEPSEENEYEVRADYSTTFKKEGRQLNVGVQYSGEVEDETENFDETISDNMANLLESLLERAPSNETENLFLAQADYSQQIGKYKFETGWRSTLTDLTTDAAFGSVNADGEFAQVDSISNLFNYREDIHAAYATFGGTVDKITFSAGLRAEQAYTTSTETEPESKVFVNNYFKVYPSVFVGYAFDDNTTVQGSYGRRVNRPRSWALNPFTDRGDPLNLREGNPLLLPELINSFELNVQQRYGVGTVTAGLYFRQLKDLISRVNLELADGVTKSTRANLDRGRDYGIEIISSLRPVKDLDLTLSLNGSKSEIIGSADDPSLDADGYIFNGNLQVSYKLPWDVNAQATYFYRGPSIRPQGTVKTIQSLDIGFRKDVLGKRGAITLRVTDVFNTRQYRFDTVLPSRQTSSQFQRESRIAYIGFQYSLQALKPERSRGGGGGGGGDDDF